MGEGQCVTALNWDILAFYLYVSDFKLTCSIEPSLPVYTVYHNMEMFVMQDLNPGESLSPLALAIISYIGAILSVICLLIVALTYLTSK